MLLFCLNIGGKNNQKSDIHFSEINNRLIKDRFKAKKGKFVKIGEMEAIRKIVTIKDNVLRVVLPDQYNNTQVELIILPAGEEKVHAQVEETKFEYEKLYGSLKSGLTIEQIDEQMMALRREWERNIS